MINHLASSSAKSLQCTLVEMNLTHVPEQNILPAVLVWACDQFSTTPERPTTFVGGMESHFGR